MEKSKPHKEHNHKKEHDEAAGTVHPAGKDGPKKTDAADAAHLQEELKRREEETAKLGEEVERLRTEIDGLKDTMLRRQADFENYKKRNAKMFADQKKMVIKDMALDVIGINDDLLRAIEASGSVKSGESVESAHASFVDGVSMISRQIEEMLKKYGVVEIDSLDREFDPNFSEAVEIEERDGVGCDTVTKVYQKGFCIEELVVRPARVRVTKPSRKETIPGDGAEGSETGASGTDEKTANQQ